MEFILNTGLVWLRKECGMNEQTALWCCTALFLLADDAVCTERVVG